MPAILVIDDSEVIRNLLSDYLTELGHQVDLASDGQQGVEMALQGEYRIVFCDIHMPKKNGWEVYQEVSKIKTQLAFVMTDSLPDELAKMAQEAGARRCLRKPFDLSEVRETVEQILSPAETR
ncbi:MAG: response regulator [Candidatus Zixiibacteriota bacterium]|nr:MAG: response regulator [candidate division Zixibacteria bacterium]